MKKLPIGISTFQEIITEGYAYVDKSEFVHKLSESGKYYFLARPRRFGKTLFVDTPKEAFEGNRKLFKGLFLYNNWNWEKQHPVINISFAEGVLQNREELDRKIFTHLAKFEKILQIRLESKDSVSSCFSELISKAANKCGQRAVILIDEYDKPILDNDFLGLKKYGTFFQYSRTGKRG